MNKLTCRGLGLVVTLVLVMAAAAGFAQDLRISEIRIDQPSIDTEEYFEIVGAPGTALDGLTYLVIGDSPSAGSGVIEEVTGLTGLTMPADGYLLVGEPGFSLATPDLTTDLQFENEDNVTHLLVSDFSGSTGQDLDTDDDGTLDLTPWTEILDLIAVVQEENPPASTVWHYGPPAVGPDGSSAPMHVYFCLQGWLIGEEEPGLDDTPGTAGCCLTLECYYASVDLTDRSTARQTIHQAIDDHDLIGFDSDASWEILELADEWPREGTTILDVYKNQTYEKVTGRDGSYEREHTWPQSYGFPNDDDTGEYPRSDYHAIFLADAAYNGSRSNLPYADCPACDERPTAAHNAQGGEGGPYPGDSNWRSGSGTTGSWETWTGALGGRRGDVARAILYMDVRYDGSDHAGGSPEPDLIVTDDRGRLSSDTAAPQDPGYMGIRSTLLEWHGQDPPDAVEHDRNEVVFAAQGNRNPFIDHPEWVPCVYLQDCGIIDQLCIPGDTTLCLPAGGDRFRVTLHFETVQGGGRMGEARAIPLDTLGLDQGGIFYFVNAGNPEFLVKVLDGCAVNGRYWVFYAATTNIGFELTVTDTLNPGATRTYLNPDVHPAATITDTLAFATCP